MIVSTRGRYALRVLVEMAEHSPDERIPLKEISENFGLKESMQLADLMIFHTQDSCMV